MAKRVLLNLLVAFVVAGLMFTVSCAKKQVVTDATTKVEDQSGSSSDTGSSTGSGGSSGSDDATLSEQNLLEAKKAAAKRRFLNQDIHFEYDSSQLSSMAKLVLKEKAAWLQENANVSVTVEGHCDERGTTEYNLALGELRAKSAKDYLVNLGIATSRLNTVSYGEEKPIDFGGSEEAWKKNRRAHFVIE